MDGKGWNVTELARTMGVEPSTASRWLSGTIPRRKMLLGLCRKLGAREEDLVPKGKPLRPVNYMDGPAPPSAVVREDPDRAFYGSAIQAMIDCLQEVKDGDAPISRLDYVHGILDTLHPMQRKPRTVRKP